MDIAQKVAQRIKEGELKQIPRSRFVMQHILVWTVVAGTVVLGSVACGLVVYLLRGHEWGVRFYTGDSFVLHVFESLPYFWLLITLVLLGVAATNSRWLKRGYLVRPIAYFGLYAVVALLLGVAIAESGKGARIDEAVAKRVPAYRNLVHRPVDDWSRPDIGLLAGNVVGTTPMGTTVGLVLEDCRNGRWILDTTTAQWRCGAVQTSTERMKFVGTTTADGVFMVSQVLPWDVTLAGSSNCVRNRVLEPAMMNFEDERIRRLRP